MKNILNRFPIQAILMAILMLAANAAFAAETIEIDQNNKSLIAPEGSDYQWFLNDEVFMGGNDQTLTIKESGEYKVVYTNEDGDETTAKVAVTVSAQGIRRIFIISDSIAANYGTRYYPQIGWGQILQLFFDPAKVEVNNKARGGRSSRSYYEEGLWDGLNRYDNTGNTNGGVKAELSTGDFLFIQFGANDRNLSHPQRGATPEEFKGFLRIYVNEAREKGAIPVLLSPLMLSGTRNVYTESGSDYRGAMIDVANELDVLFIDVNMKSYEVNKALGADYTSRMLYMVLDAGEYPNGDYSGGLNDYTHIQEMGAYKVCEMISEGLNELKDDADAAALVDALKPTYNVNVIRGSQRSGLITVSGKYPVGTTITLKARINTGFEWIHWEDENNQLLTTDMRTSFTMEAKDYTFTSVVKDCAGNLNGDGYTDKCNTCVDGTIVKSGCIGVIETETACYATGTKGTRTEGTSNITFLSLEAGSSDTTHYTVRVPKDSTYTFGLKYSKGATGQTVDIYANGKLAVEDLILFASPDGWTISEFEIDLHQANNFVSVVFEDVKETIEVDLLTAYVSGVQRGSTCKDIPDLIEMVLGTNVAHEMSIYPNPFFDHANLNFYTPQQYRIVSLSGNVIEENTCLECQVGRNLAAGTYVLQTGTGKEIKSYLIVKK